jgi:hypothetical protein
MIDNNLLLVVSTYLLVWYLDLSMIHNNLNQPYINTKLLY